MAGEDEGRAQLDAAIHDYLTVLAVSIEADAKAGCPVDSGDLARSITYEVRGSGADTVARIGSNLSYAAAVELGSAPHIIRATNARVLANRATGQVFGPVVHHPGTRAQPYLRPALYRQRGGA